MANFTNTNEIIEIDDDSGDDQGQWRPRDPAMLQAMNGPLDIEPDFPRRRDHNWQMPPMQLRRSPPVPLDFFDDVMDPALINIDDAIVREAGPQMGMDVVQDYDTCLQEIMEIFPDISRDHVQQLYDAQLLQPRDGQSLAQHLITHILEKGKYPKEKDRLKELKRKRYVDSDEEEAAQMKDLDRGTLYSQYSHAA